MVVQAGAQHHVHLVGEHGIGVLAAGNGLAWRRARIDGEPDVSEFAVERSPVQVVLGDGEAVEDDNVHGSIES